MRERFSLEVVSARCFFGLTQPDVLPLPSSNYRLCFVFSPLSPYTSTWCLCFSRNVPSQRCCVSPCTSCVSRSEFITSATTSYLVSLLHTALAAVPLLCAAGGSHLGLYRRPRTCFSWRNATTPNRQKPRSPSSTRTTLRSSFRSLYVSFPCFSWLTFPCVKVRVAVAR